jgi:hypothetical protein
MKASVYMVVLFADYVDRPNSEVTEQKLMPSDGASSYGIMFC